jgi:guanylate kinase
MKPIQGKIIIIVAPSGTGKTTVLKKVKAKYPTLKESVSFTTRAPREGEVHGVNYFYIGLDEFKKMIKEDKFLEWAEVHGNYYGTSKEFVEKELGGGSHLIFDLDVQGVESFKKYFGDLANVIFISPPSFEELEKRLRERGTEGDHSLNLRLQNARKELARKDDFDFLVYNHEIEQCLTDISSLLDQILG